MCNKDFKRSVITITNKEEEKKKRMKRTKKRSKTRKTLLTTQGHIHFNENRNNIYPIKQYSLIIILHDLLVRGNFLFI